MKKLIRWALVVSILLLTNYFSVYALDKSAINSNDVLYGNELVARRAYLYRDVLIKAYCADGGGMAIATRGTVALNAPMASIHYEVYKIHDPLQGFEIMSVVTDTDGIGYKFELEGYSDGYTQTEYNPSYCKIDF